MGLSLEVPVKADQLIDSMLHDTVLDEGVDPFFKRSLEKYVKKYGGRIAKEARFQLKVSFTNETDAKNFYLEVTDRGKNAKLAKDFKDPNQATFSVIVDQRA